MKIIDLLNKIANGEEVPKEIMFKGKKYKYKDGIDYENENGTYLLSVECVDINFLIDEVEILEEEKKIPEKLETYKEVNDEDYFANLLKVSKDGECEIDEAISIIFDKINAIIDYLKSKGE